MWHCFVQWCCVVCVRETDCLITGAFWLFMLAHCDTQHTLALYACNKHQSDNSNMSVMFNIGLFNLQWSCVLLPSPNKDLPFSVCAVKDFTQAINLTNGPPVMCHKDWTPAARKIMCPIPSDKICSIIWKIGLDCWPRFFLCPSCQVPDSFDHIIFDCPVTNSLWMNFCQMTGFNQVPSFKTIFAGPIQDDTVSFIRFQLAFIFIHYVWCSWWTHFNDSSDKVERWERRVISVFFTLSQTN